MRIKIFIILIMCVLCTKKKVTSQENNNNIILFTKYYSSDNYSKAIEIGQQILLDKELETPKEQLDLIHNLLTAHSKADDFEGGYDFILRLIELEEDQLILNYLRLYKAAFSGGIGKSKEAKRIYHTLLEENNQLFLHDSVKAKIYHNLSIMYARENDQKTKHFYLKRAYEIEKKMIKLYPNQASYNVTASTLASSYSLRYKQYNSANKIFKEALSLPFNKTINQHNYALYATYIDYLISLGFGDKAMHYASLLEHYYLDNAPNYKSNLADLYSSLLFYHYPLNNYTNTILYANKCLNATPTSKRNAKEQVRCLTSLADIYRDLGYLDRSQYYIDKSVAKSKQFDSTLLYRCYAQAATNNAILQNDEKAYAYIDSIFAVQELLKLPFDKKIEGKIAWSYYSLGQYTQSLHHFGNIEEIIKKNDTYSNYAKWDIIHSKARCHINLKNYKQAQALLSQASEEIIREYPHLIDPNAKIQTSSLGFLFQYINVSLVHCLFLDYHQTGNKEHLHQAYKSIIRADIAIENLRSKQTFDKDRLYTGKDFFYFTQQSVNVAIELYNITQEDQYLQKAFEFIQKGKSYALLQGVNDKKRKLNSGVPIELITELNNNKERYDFFEQRYNNSTFSEENDSTLLSELSNNMSLHMARIDSIEKFIQLNYPKYKQLKNNNAELSVADVQAKLDSQQVVIDYYQSNEQLIRFTIFKNNYKCDIIPTDKAFINDIEQCVNEISKPFIGTQKIDKIQAYAASSHRLYTILLGDLSKEISDKTLIIVPHGQLSYLPFETLLTEDYSDKKPDFRTYPWLIKQQSVVYSYNAALLPAYQEEASKFNSVIGFAPEYSGNTSAEKIDLNQHLLLDTILPPLNGALDEINAIERSYRSTAIIGKQASKERFIESMLDNDILHLAMHSINDENQPFNSQLIFSSSDSVSGSLKAEEIYNYAIKSPLIILSSCNTGRGQRAKGEGLLSIARAFTFSGVESQIMTLWPVNDASGIELTERFYKKLKDGQRKDIALQQSKLDYLANSDAIKSHPYYWANYVFSGNTSPLKAETPKGLFLSLLALAIFCVTIFFYVDYRKRN